MKKLLTVESKSENTWVNSQLTYSRCFIFAFTLVASLFIIADANAQNWATNETVNNLIATNSSGALPRIVSDQIGGVITVFVKGDDVMAQGCDNIGSTTTLWPTPVPVIVGKFPSNAPVNASYIAVSPDGGGGIYVAIMYSPGVIRAQHVSNLGVAMWGNGIDLTALPPIASGESVHPSISGTTITWTGRLPTSSGDRILAQQLDDLNGSKLWGTVAKEVSPSSTGNQRNCEIVSTDGSQIVGDQYGHLFVTWEDTRNGNSDIFCEGLFNDGNFSDPFPICTAPGDQLNPMIKYYPSHGGGTTFSPGGIYIAWEDGRNTSNSNRDIYVHCPYDGGPDVDNDYSGDGILVCSQPGGHFVINLDYDVYSSGFSEDLLLAWIDNNGSSGIYGQRIDKMGITKWGENGKFLISGACLDLTLVTINGEAIITYSVANGVLGQNFFGQRISAKGETLWKPTGMPLTVRNELPVFLQSAIISGNDACDRSVASVWWDGRGSVSTYVADVYGQAMHWIDGSLGGPPFSKPDVWMKDNEADYGANDQIGTWNGEPFWESPDIWNTYNDPLYYPIESLEHTNPVIPWDNWIQVRVRNRGCFAGPGIITIYETIANIASTWPSINWTILGTINVPNLEPGEETIVNLHWIPASVGIGDDGHHCIVARYSSNDELLDPTTNDPPERNGIAQKNMHLVDESEARSFFLVRNIDTIARTLDMDFDLYKLQPITSKLNGLGIKINLDREVFTEWSKAGQKGTGIKVNQDSSIQLTDTVHASIMGMPLAASATGAVNCSIDSLNKVKDEHFLVRISQHTHGDGINGRRLDGGLTWDVHTTKTVIHATGGDTIASERPTNRPMHIQTYAIYVSNGNQQKGTIDRVIVGVDSKSIILAVGPPQDSQKTTISLARDRTGRTFVYNCDQENQTRLYAGEAFRPIYLTVSSTDGSTTILHYTTLDANNKTLTIDSVQLTDPLSIVHKDDPTSIMKPQHLFAAYPNPATTSTSLQIHLDESEIISLSVIDQLGKEVGNIVNNQRIESGDHVFTYSTNGLSSGTYYVMLTSSTGRESQGFKVIK